MKQSSGQGLAMLVVVLVTGCAAAPTLPPPVGVVATSDAELAVVTLSPRSQSNVSGRLDVGRFGNGVRITGVIAGLPGAGSYGFHVKESGDCSSPDAASAGGIFNPQATLHGRPASAAHKAGGLDNIEADPSGVARVDVQLAGVTLGGGRYNDVANRSLVVHARPDDYATQPEGAAGARIACGTIGIVLPPPVAPRAG